MSFPNYEAFTPQQGEDGSAPAAAGAPGQQPQMQPIESTGGQFPANNAGGMPAPEGQAGDSKTTLW